MRRIIIALICLLPVVTFGQIMKWTDKDGVVHYSDSATRGETDKNTVQMTRALDKSTAPPPVSSGTDGTLPDEVPGFVLKGKIIDPQNRIHQSLLDEGAVPRGTIDAMGRQVIFITAYKDSKKIAEIHPDGDLSFELKPDTPITRLTLEVSGCGIYMENHGPWQTDTLVTMDLEKDGYVVDGFVKASDGLPVKRVMVSAFDDADRKIAFCYTGSQGQFLFFTNRPVYRLQSSADRLTVQAIGPWHQASTVMLTPEAEQLFTIKGRVTGKDGKPAKGVRVSANFSGGGGKSAMTREDGRYEITVNQDIAHLYAYWDVTKEEARKEGPFSADQTVNFAFTKGDVFTLEGRVLDKNGAPAYNAFVFALDDQGYRIKTTRADRNGHYRLEIGRPAMSLNAYHHPMDEKTMVAGPWQNDNTVDIRLVY